VPIPNQQGALPVPTFIGTPAVPHPVSAKPIPTNPAMDEAPWNNFHDDTYMSDTYTVAGPVGRDPSVFSTYLGTAEELYGPPANITFDRWGNLVAVVVRTPGGSLSTTLTLTLLDPVTLDTLAECALPDYVRTSTLDYVAGAYFYADQDGCSIVATAERAIWVVSHAHTASGWAFSHERTWDLTSALPEGDQVESMQPDFAARVWVTSKGGTACTVDSETGTILGFSNDIRDLGEQIANGHCADEDNGVYIVSTNALYRWDADACGRPEVTWREVVGTGDRIKPGRVDLGSGSTPTAMGSDFVTIADNADPHMNVLVFRRAKRVKGKRMTAKVPVCGPYEGCTESSLVATEKSIVVENNYGYRSPLQDTTGGRTTTPGLTRIDIDRFGRGRVVWTNTEVIIPNVTTKLCLPNGLLYCLAKPAGPGTTDRWYFAAVDFRTGKTIWQRLAGTGILFDSKYMGMFIGRDGTLYAGVLGGVVAMRDGK
jgi:hypothetical protein